MGMTSLDRETWVKPRRRARAPTAFSCSDHLGGEKQQQNKKTATVGAFHRFHIKNQARGEESREARRRILIKCFSDAHVYECRRRTAKLVIPRERTPLRSSSTLSKSSSLHTSRESPVLPEGRKTQSLHMMQQLIQAVPSL